MRRLVVLLVVLLLVGIAGAEAQEDYPRIMIMHASPWWYKTPLDKNVAQIKEMHADYVIVNNPFTGSADGKTVTINREEMIARFAGASAIGPRFIFLNPRVKALDIRLNVSEGNQNDPARRKRAEKEAKEWLGSLKKRIPVLAGVYISSAWLRMHPPTSPVCRKKFVREYLPARIRSEPALRKLVDLSDPDRINNAGLGSRPTDTEDPFERAVRAEWIRFRRRTRRDYDRDLVRWFGEELPGLKSVRTVGPGTYYMATAYQWPTVKIEPVGYASAERRFASFKAELLRNSVEQPAIFGYTTYEHRVPDILEYMLPQAAAHGDGVLFGDWERIAPETIGMYYGPGAGAAKRKAVADFFAKAGRMAPYLVGTSSPHRAAVLFSDEHYEIADRRIFIRRRRMSVTSSLEILNQYGIWRMLKEGNVGCDPLVLDMIDRRTLDRYKTVVLSGIRYLTGKQFDMLKGWIRDGGTLVVTGGSLGADQWLGRDSRMLRELAGISTDRAGRSGGTLKERQGKNDGFTFTMPKIAAGPIRYKPGKLRLGVGTVNLQTIPARYARFDLAGAEVIGKFKNGDSAVTRKALGKGKVFFFAPAWPGLCFDMSKEDTNKWESSVVPEFRAFDRSMLAGFCGLVEASLGGEKDNVSMEVISKPFNVEVTLRSQPRASRYIVHFVNFETKSEVGGVEVRLTFPSGKVPEKVFFAGTKEKVRGARIANRVITISPGKFRLHRAVVIDWVNGTEKGKN